METVEREERKDARRRFQHVDTVNVEVAVVKDRELYSWPGGKEFEDRDVAVLVGAGLMSTGGFRSAIKSVLIDNSSTIKFRGNEEILGYCARARDWILLGRCGNPEVAAPGNCRQRYSAGSSCHDHQGDGGLFPHAREISRFAASAERGNIGY